MAELIDKQDAVELAMKYCPDDDGAVQCDGDIRGLLDELENLPPAQPEQKWIPVSERLPEEGGEYLTSVYHIVGPISVFHPEDDTYVSDVAIMKFYDKFPSTVRAWMPLPEPYKVGRNE